MLVLVRSLPFLSIDDFSNDTITAYANEDGFRQFLTLNIPFEVFSPHRCAMMALHLTGMKSETGLVIILPMMNTWQSMEGFAGDYPDLCRLTEFGTSINSRKLLALKITDNPGIHEEEPVVFYSSTMHGDETAGLCADAPADRTPADKLQYR